MKLQKLNDAQMSAVTAPLGATMVLAGAGSGKTRVLTNRILYLVTECGVSPNEILAITFTNKAAKEMKTRLVDFDCNAEFMQISTIHSFCARVLRNEAERFARTNSFTIYAEDDKRSLLKHVIKDNFDDADAKIVDSFADSISSIKNNAPEFKCESSEDIINASNADDFMAETMEKLSGVSQESDTNKLAKIIAEYTKQMTVNNAMDFDDLLYYTHKLFSEFPDILEKYQEHFKYILIDEFQDVNKVQYNIFCMLAKKYGNIFVVGDDDQSIYSWRGADSTNMVKFSRDFPSAQLYKLEQNYRSTKKILDIANHIISKNTGRFEKVLWTENSDGVKPQLFSGYSENDEAYYVVEQIKGLCAMSGYSLKDFAILMRVNALSRSFEMELGKNHIPYRVFGGFKFFERREVRDVFAHLRLLDNPHDNEAFIRAINVPRRRGIGDTTIGKLRELSADYGLSMVDVISDERNLDVFNSGTKAKLKLFYDEYQGFFEFSKKSTLVQLCHKVMADLEFRDVYREEDDEERALNIDQLEELIIEYQRANKTATLSDFLQTVSLVNDTDNADDSQYVTISTIHAAKGLEFKTVFVVGLEEGIFPSARSTFDSRDLQEERRLMYVATTRAMQRLYLTCAKSRFLYGERKSMLASKYYSEVQKFLAPPSKPVSERDLSNDAFLDRLNKTAPAPKPIDTGKTNQQISAYKVGQVVMHDTFGQGIILRIGGDVADVVFEKVGKKTLNVRFAPLTIIK